MKSLWILFLADLVTTSQIFLQFCLPHIIILPTYLRLVTHANGQLQLQQ